MQRRGLSRGGLPSIGEVMGMMSEEEQGCMRHRSRLDKIKDVYPSINLLQISSRNAVELQQTIPHTRTNVRNIQIVSSVSNRFHREHRLSQNL